jgi:hypothetical protein
MKMENIAEIGLFILNVVGGYGKYIFYRGGITKRVIVDTITNLLVLKKGGKLLESISECTCVRGNFAPLSWFICFPGVTTRCGCIFTAR